MHKMVCRFCNEEKGKLCKAHLIPESFYRFMYPNETVEGDALHVLLHNVDYAKKSRIGVYDDKILCSSCDARLGELDNYGQHVLLNHEPTLVRQVEDTDIFILRDIDSLKLIQFFLSVLWRCSISKRDEAKNVNIGVKFENEIRELLLHEKSTIDNFSIIITRYKFLNDNYKKMAFMPVPKKIESINYYFVFFPNGYKIYIKVDGRPQHTKLNPFALTTENFAYVTSTDFFEQTDEYRNISKRAKIIGKKITHAIASGAPFSFFPYLCLTAFPPAVGVIHSLVSLPLFIHAVLIFFNSRSFYIINGIQYFAQQNADA